MKKLIFMASTTGLLSASSIAIAGSLDWSWELESRHYGRKAVVEVESVQKSGNRMVFDVLIRHTAGGYACFYVNANANSVLMDDDRGNEYYGAELTINQGQNNKLAPNQRKAMTISIPAPKDGVENVNVHFGFKITNINSDDNCRDVTKYEHYDQHQLNWSVDGL